MSHDPHTTLRAHIERHARRADFFTLVGLLERLEGGRAPIGGDGPPSLEGLRLCHDPSLALRSTDVSAATERGDGRWVVTTAFLGLTGAISPLPLYLCEAVLNADSARLRDFYDLFHHRLLSLFYRRVVRDRWAHSFQRNAGDRWSRRILALAGLDSPNSRIPAPVRLRLVALRLGHRGTLRGLELGLQAVLGEALGGAAVSVTPFVVESVEIDRGQRLRLGASRLGDGAMIGARMRCASSKVSIRVGPLTATSYRRLLPGGDLLALVNDAFELLVDERLDYSLELVLPAGSAPPFRLGASPPAALGRTTWLSGKYSRDTRITVNPRRSARRD